MTPEDLYLIAEEVLGDLAPWAHQCHAASIKLVKSGRLGPCRVARGRCRGVGGQHSWVVLGDDCYDEEATIIDPTLWSYRDDVDGIVVVKGQHKFGHTPHGAGSIWRYGQPPEPVGEVIPLTAHLSASAQSFMDLAAPHGLDRAGWSVLLQSPVEGWPSKEIISAACEHPRLAVIVPIDIEGMVTDRNPKGLYLKGEPVEN